MKRYADIYGKNPREVVLLKSTGCRVGRCGFCDYWTDAEPDPRRCAAFNREILKQVRGSHGTLEIINSASFDEFPPETAADLLKVCREKRIKKIITEQHFNYRQSLPAIRETFAAAGTDCRFIVSLETFDAEFREFFLRKRFTVENPVPEAAAYYQWVNLLWGVRGQTFDGLVRDIETGLELFERINLNIFIPNTTPFERDDFLVNFFYNSAFFAEIKEDSRIEILDHADPRAPDHLGGIGYADV